MFSCTILLYITDIKFASGVNNILALYTQYLPNFCEEKKNLRTRVEFEPTTFAILEQCLTN